MPKLKTNRSAAKRFRFTKNGKIKKAGSAHRHNMSKKKPDTRRTSRGTSLVAIADIKEVIKLMPYGG